MKAKQKDGLAETATFSKDRLLTFERYRDRRDLLTAVLADDREYTFDEVDAAIETFMKKGVN